MRHRHEIRNDYHNTTVTVLVPSYRDGEPRTYISHAVYVKALDTLCPSRKQGCTCRQSMASGSGYDYLGYIAGPNAIK